VRRIGAALKAIDRAFARGESGIDEDAAFHHAIATATGNSQFPRFLEFLGRFVIPRRTVRPVAERTSEQRTYLARIQEEHRTIFAAVRDGDAAAARSAMRRHLVRSRERYRSLAGTQTGA
jgi:DNA-binding FadR family transcriptional regulator